MTKSRRPSYATKDGLVSFSRANRNVMPAFLAGSALFLLAAALVAGDFASARGAFIPPDPLNLLPSAAARSDPAPDASLRHHRLASNGLGRRAVCVRLCDGFFFPSGQPSAGDEGCVEQCPDAPTALYSMPADSDKIEDAVSLAGAPYTALPVADRHRATYDNACTCQRSFTRSYVAELSNDRTLHNGDLVMTDEGFEEFRRGKSGEGRFVALSRAPDVPKSTRAELMAMERAGAFNRQFGAYSSPEAPNAPTEPSVAASPPTRPHRGMVTVDDGVAGIVVK